MPGGGAVPAFTSLGAVFPNPSRDRHLIEVVIAPGHPAQALRVYDVTARFVHRLDLSRMEPGSHRVEWDGRGRNGRAAPGRSTFWRLRLPLVEARGK